MIVDCLLHVHSSFSYDSKTDLAEIARIAREQGIRCVLMSEHNNFMDATQMAAFVTQCDRLSDETLLIVPGLELAFDSNRVHLLAFGVREFIDSSGPDCTFRSLVDSIRRAGGLAVLAHPSHRQAVARLDPEDLQLLDGIEIWNVKNGNKYLPTGVDLELLDGVRRVDPQVFGFAGVDWHHVNRFSRLVAAVDTPELTRGVILERLKMGAFQVRGGLVTLSSRGEPKRARVMMYKLASTALASTRRVAYRWQSRLERSGFRTPKVISAAARRLF